MGLVVIIQRFLIQLREMGGDEGKGITAKAERAPVEVAEVERERGVNGTSVKAEEKGMKGKENDRAEENEEKKENTTSPSAARMKSSKELKEAEKFIFNFFKYTILIVGFAYAFLALGLDLNASVEVLGSSITVANILNAILTGIIVGVFIVYFLPFLLNLILTTSIRLYENRHKSEEQRVKGLQQEIEKITPGLKRMLVYLIILIAAMAVLNYLGGSSGGGSSSSHLPESYESTPELQQYLDMLEVIVRSLIIMVVALLLTMLTPIIVYALSSSQENIRESNVYNLNSAFLCVIGPNSNLVSLRGF